MIEVKGLMCVVHCFVCVLIYSESIIVLNNNIYKDDSYVMQYAHNIFIASILFYIIFYKKSRMECLITRFCLPKPLKSTMTYFTKK